MIGNKFGWEQEWNKAKHYLCKSKEIRKAQTIKISGNIPLYCAGDQPLWILLCFWCPLDVLETRFEIPSRCFATDAMLPNVFDGVENHIRSLVHGDIWMYQFNNTLCEAYCCVNYYFDVLSTDGRCMILLYGLLCQMKFSCYVLPLHWEIKHLLNNTASFIDQVALVYYFIECDLKGFSLGLIQGICLFIPFFK